MFMVWPGQLEADSVNEHPILALDLYPTFAALGQATVPSEKILDGKNVWSDVLGGTNPHAF